MYIDRNMIPDHGSRQTQVMNNELILGALRRSPGPRYTSFVNSQLRNFTATRYYNILTTLRYPLLRRRLDEYSFDL